MHHVIILYFPIKAMRSSFTGIEFYSSSASHFKMASQPSKPKRVNLKDSDKDDIFKHLLEVSVERKLPTGAIAAVAADYGVSVNVIYRLWKRGLTPPATGLFSAVASRRKGHVGRKMLHGNLLDKIKAAPADQRTTFRDLSAATGIPKSTLHDRFKRAFFRKYSRPLRPILTVANMYFRSKWALRHICSDLSVASMDNYVHVDEKWFFLKVAKCSFYGVPGETPPPRRVQNKNHILKVVPVSGYRVSGHLFIFRR